MIGLSGMDSQHLINVRGGLSTITSNKKFHDDIKVLLETTKGTLVGDPEFGSNLYRYLYEPANEATASMIRQEVASAISNYYTNFTVRAVDVTFREKTILLNITYNIVNTNVGDTIVLEFIRGW